MSVDEQVITRLQAIAASGRRLFAARCERRGDGGGDFIWKGGAGLKPVALESGAMTFEQARLTLDCRKLFKSPMSEANFIDKSILGKWYGNKPGGSLHDVYVVEIENVFA